MRRGKAWLDDAVETLKIQFSNSVAEMRVSANRERRPVQGFELFDFKAKRLRHRGESFEINLYLFNLGAARALFPILNFLFPPPLFALGCSSEF